MTVHIQAALSYREGHFAKRGLNLASAVPGVRSLVLCLLFVVSLFDVCAQTASTGALTGTVTDPSGAVVPIAKITLRNYGTDGTLTTITGPDGLYRFSLLPAGEYELTVQAVDFKAAVVSHLSIQITEVRSVTTQLAVAGTRASAPCSAASTPI